MTRPIRMVCNIQMMKRFSIETDSFNWSVKANEIRNLYTNVQKHSRTYNFWWGKKNGKWDSIWMRINFLWFVYFFFLFKLVLKRIRLSSGLKVWPSVQYSTYDICSRKNSMALANRSAAVEFLLPKCILVSILLLCFEQNKIGSTMFFVAFAFTRFYFDIDQSPHEYAVKSCTIYNFVLSTLNR